LLENLYQIYQQHPVVCIDSRSVTKGCLFFALKGTHFDGNDFALQAVEAGAAYAVVDNVKLLSHPQLIQVRDVLTALQQLATMHRRQLNIPILGITGSNGKTTTKELVSRVLAVRYKIGVTQGNLNNHIGVPLTLLQMDSSTQIGVVEMGANHLGEIAQLCTIAEPSHGLITNIGRAHLEGFGSLEGVQKAKGELYDYLAAHNGVAFYNADNATLSAMMGERKLKKVVRYGMKKNRAHVLATNKNYPFLRLSIHTYPPVETQLIGAYNADNILAALAVGDFFGVKKEDAVTAINTYLPANNRSQLIQTAQHSVIMDAYNANPSSMRAAIENFAHLDEPNKWVILGDMKELGAESAAEHVAILALLQQKRFKNMWLVGEHFTHAAEGKYTCFDTVESVIEQLKSNSLPGGATVLVKGSHSVALDKLANYL